ncbi:MAG: gluconokinase [Chloroflexi bacterium]|nr:gluconokinase [Chloroflexota bacterium]MCL5273855.1 gluconokinase [Chloroflexota bacterium]
MANVLVLDIGSSSTRAILYDEHASLVSGAIAERSFSFNVGTDGRSEDDPEQAVERVMALLDELQSRYQADRRLAPIAAMGISAYACSLLCLDAQGKPLTPVYTYGDTRFASDARALRDEVDEMAALQRTGCRIRANYLPSRIMWLKRNLPDVFQKTRWFVSLSDYICLRLFGAMRAGLSVWSWSGLLNRRTLNWDEDWLKQLGISAEQLPVIAGQSEWVEPTHPDFADRWPMLRGVRCLPACGDGAAANIGSGCVDDRQIAVTIGTTAALRVVKAGLAIALPSALWGYRVDHQRELVGGATTEGGSVFAWLRRTLKLPEPQALEDALGGMAPDSHNLTVLPLFSGERSPGYSEDSRATLYGLSLDSDPVAIARACLESIAYRLGMIYNDLQSVAQPGARLIASGGALLASAAWRQIVADVAGAPLTICEELEATSRGIAMLVLERTQGMPDLSGLAQLTRLGRTYEPDAGRHAIYQTAMTRQQELYRRLLS